MRITTLFRGIFAICFLSAGMIAMPAIVNPEPQSAVWLAAQPSSQLTEENIRQVLTAIENAIAQRNIEGVLKFVAPFVYTEVTVESSGSTFITPLEGKDKFRDLLAEIFARIKESNVVTQQTEIEITSDGQLGIANISTAEEIVTQDGKRYFSSSTDTLRFAWLNNQPTIVSMTIKGWLAERSQK